MQVLNFLQLLSTPYSFLFVESGAFLVKLYILGFMGSQRQRIPYACWYTAWRLFIATVFCSAFVNLHWVIKLLSLTYVPTLNYHFVLLILRLAWAFYVWQRLLTILFFKYMTDKDYRLTTQDKLLILVSSLVAFYFILLAFTDFSASNVEARCAYLLTDPLEARIMRYCCYFSDVVTVIYTLRIMNSASFAALPKLLRWQARTFALYFILPYATSTSLANLRIAFNIENLINQALGQGSYILEMLSTILITVALWYCVRRLISERFLGIGLRVFQKPPERRQP